MQRAILCHAPVFSGLIHVVACPSAYSFYITAFVSPFDRYALIYQSDTWVCCHFLALVNNAPINICVQVSELSMFSFPFGSMLEWNSGSNGNSMLNFLTNCQTFFFKMAVPFYIISNIMFCVFVYFKKTYNDKMLWIRNSFSIFVENLLNIAVCAHCRKKMP